MATSRRNLIQTIAVSRHRPSGAVGPDDGGSLGVKSVYAQLAFELKSTMLMSGAAKVSELNRDSLARI